ncbi:hypothetical protein ACFWN1_12675 [Streptomyces sp. NPDC058459]|uniref:hypothetical protein n=1 Tax=Streptomyces sp. NPDC058459 TaxID=3346508 RepID=UPI00364C85AD
MRGRFSGNDRPDAWIAAGLIRMQNGALAERWDTIREAVSEADSVSRLPMYGGSFPEER